MVLLFLIIVYSIVLYYILYICLDNDTVLTLTCSFCTITPISWRYSDLKSRSFYNHFIFYIIYTDILYPLNGVVVQALQHVIRLVTYRCQEHRHLIITNMLLLALSFLYYFNYTIWDIVMPGIFT